MTVQRLWIPGPLPGMNETIKAAKARRGAVYTAMKLKWTDAIAWHAKAARLKPVTRARFTFRWVEAARKRDPDNIAAAQKYVLDGLVTAGVLTNDGWAQVAGLNHLPPETGPSPGVEVTIEEIGAS